ncbi:MAG: FtsK/SpoIIIE domain-containing protein [Jatrophihabitans sp.]
MRIEFTVRSPFATSDVAVVAAPGTLVADVATALAGVVGVPPGGRMWCGTRPVPGTAVVGADPALRSGAVLDIGSMPSPPSTSSLLDLVVAGGPSAGERYALARGRAIIGRDAQDAVCLLDDRVSRRHAALEVGPSGATVHDLGSTNGTTVDGVEVGPAGTPVDPGQVIRVGDSLLRLVGPAPTIAPVTLTDGALVVNRGPRPRPAATPGPIDLPVPNRPPAPGRVQWFTALLPAVAGAVMAWVLDAPAFLLFALLSPMMMLSSSLGDRVHWRRSRRQEASLYRTELSAARDAVLTGLRAEATARRDAAPDPVQVASIASGPEPRIWERRCGDPEHLVVRLGWADQHSRLQSRAGQTVAPAGQVISVPVTSDLRTGPLGLAGPTRVVDGLARWVITQLAVLHSPVDLEIAALLGRPQRWRFMRWLPQLSLPPGADAAGQATTLATVVDRLERRRADLRRSPGPWVGRWLVLLVDQTAAARHATALESVLMAGPAVGITAICLADNPTVLPGACRSWAFSAPDASSRITVRTAAGEQDAIADQVGIEWSDRVARSLAPLSDPGTAHGRLPESCRLSDLLDLGEEIGPEDIRRRWNRADGGAHTVLGVAGDARFVVDLVADGPHTLVAGTTGSGKSELLRSLVLGLAVNHPPDQLTFLLVDYKGGAAFAGCDALPHTGGVVTDLDAQLTGRALRSLHAELLRRERLFADLGADDLPGYRRRAGVGATPVPRLVIVVDEFAALADELPDFVTGLVGVAQRGRSLGLHLVLATQRPGTAVSAEIRANTSLRIALRVTDSIESTDVVGAADAAHLDPRHPGRAWVRSAASFTCVQTGLVSGPRTGTAQHPVIEILGEWLRRPPSTAPTDTGPDELADLIGIIAGTAQRFGIRALPGPWRPVLPDSIPMTSLPADSAPDRIAIGLLDLPDQQLQTPLTVSLGVDGSFLLAGRAHSGRTTALAALALAAARELAPDRLTLHAVDGSGSLLQLLEGLPHTATGLGPGAEDLTATLFERLLARCGIAGAQCRTMLLIDSWDAVLSSVDDGDAMHLADLLTRLLRAAPTAALTVALTGGSSLLTPRVAGSFPTRLILALSDRSDYGSVGLLARDVPTVLPPGRGVRAHDGAVFQLAHAGSAPTLEAAHIEAATIVHRWRGVAIDPSAVRLRVLPDRVRLQEIRSQRPVGAGREAGLLLGVGGDAGVPCRLDLLGVRARLLVAGPPRSGKSTVLHTLLVEADRLSIATLVVCTRRSPLNQVARALDTPILDPAGGPPPVTPPDGPTLLLIDDSESFVDGAVADGLIRWIRSPDAPLTVVAAGRSDDVATDYRGVAAELRRHRCGVLLRPGPLDGELFGVRVPRRTRELPPGRGVVVGDPRWGPLFEAGAPVPIQIAQP